MNNKNKSIQVGEGIRLYRQSRSKFWWVSIRIDGEEVRQSTKTENQDDASRIALEMGMEANVKVKYGIPLKVMPSFSDLAEEVIQKLQSAHYGKQNDKAVIAALKNYLIPNLGRKPVNKIDRPAIYDFYQWREQKTGKEISPTQRSNTNMALKRVLNHACDKGYIKQADFPELPTPSISKKQSRDYFSTDELKNIFSGENFESFIAASRSYKTKAYRRIFPYYIAFLFLTGVRPGEETVWLKYGDLRLVEHKEIMRCVAQIRKGKTTRYSDGREILVDKFARGAIESVIKCTKQYHLYRGKLERLINRRPDDYIFMISFDDGTEKIPPFEKIMGQYMKFLGMGGKGHVLYSFRHSYITYQLLRDVLAYDVAKQCGTSEAMIEQHYDHVKPLQRADKLEFSNIVDGMTFDQWLMGVDE
ncbi:MAG: phage integrase SAM-like domain-containing protein [Pseudomonadales bacterium]